MQNSIPWQALILVLAVSLPAWAEEPEPAEDYPPWQPSIVTHLSGTHGLTGFGTMVDSRIPSPFLAGPQEDSVLGSWSSRFALRYQLDLRNRDVLGQGTKYRLEEREHLVLASYGLTVQGLDFAVSLPYVYEERGVFVRGRRNPARDLDSGIGSVVVGAKAAFRIPNFFLEDWAIAALAPYAVARIPAGSSSVRADAAEIEYGIAIAGPFGYSFRYNGNFGLLNREGGLFAFIYRFGFSAVPFAEPAFALRFYSHIDGIEYEGKPTSTMHFEVGGQVLIQGLLSVDLGVSWRILDARFGESELRREMRVLGDRFMRVEDKGALAVTFGISVLL